MKRPVAMIATIFQLGYSAMLVAIGTAGIFTARWELATVFGIDPSMWPAAAVPTMLNQYRFLKSVELGAGLFCLAYRSKILAGTRASAVFLAIVGLGVAARTWSWIVDGRPAALFIVFLALEACVFAAVALHLRTSHGHA
jgi:Domain of unknown function (DUF4345)